MPNRATSLALVATAGPQSFGQELSLFEAGATCIRLNASHLSPAEVFEHATRITSLVPAVRCVVDLQGAKMRLGPIAPIVLSRGQTYLLTADPEDAARPQTGAVPRIFVPHPELFEQVIVGEELSVDDGRARLCVTGRGEGSLTVTSESEYLLKPRKGINRESHPVMLADLGPGDREVLRLCGELPRVDYAVSFACHGHEVSWVKSRIPGARVALKIERAEAVSSIERLAEHADELWVCRGDLGAQLGYARLGSVVHSIDPRALGTHVLMAGQVLEHLTQHTEPTRSEICHIADILARGYAGIVLSDETAIGQHPANAALWARRLLDAACA